LGGNGFDALKGAALGMALAGVPGLTLVFDLFYYVGRNCSNFTLDDFQPGTSSLENVCREESAWGAWRHEVLGGSEEFQAGLAMGETGMGIAQMIVPAPTSANSIGIIGEPTVTTLNSGAAVARLEYAAVIPVSWIDQYSIPVAGAYNFASGSRRGNDDDNGDTTPSDEPQPYEGRTPGSGPGGHGIVSEFGSLDGWTREETIAFLNSLNPRRVAPPTPDGYIHYIFEDGSELWIYPNSEIVRVPAPMYDSTGRRIKGYHVDISGELRRAHDYVRERLQQ
jgi:hypothetical protein